MQVWRSTPSLDHDLPMQMDDILDFNLGYSCYFLLRPLHTSHRTSELGEKMFRPPRKRPAFCFHKH
jgi:hypothetical protein